MENYEELIEKVVSSNKITRAELEERISEKISKLSGLISKEGAVHIVANELGIRLFTPTESRLQIGRIMQGMRNVDTVGKVTRVFEKREFVKGEGKGQVASVILADETGTVRVVLWGELADRIKNITEGDVVGISGGYVKINNNGQKEVHLNERSKIRVNPEGVKINQGQPARKWIADIKEKETGIEIVGSIVQVFEPRFFEICPKCGKRARPFDGQFKCEADGVVNPNYGCVINALIDDGTANIRLVMFRKQATQLLKTDETRILDYKDSPERFLQAKESLIGSIVKVKGKAEKNSLYDRMEIIADYIDPNPNPEEELKIISEIEAKMNSKSLL